MVYQSSEGDAVAPAQNVAAARESAKEMAAYFDRLWPITRSIAGPGVRETHDILSELLPLDQIEIPSGTKVFDWTVPREWRVREAYVVDPTGKRILDVAGNNLHLVNFSSPFRGHVSRQTLDSHLHSRPDKPEAIPYITSYYTEDWGFCLTQSMRDRLPEGDYEVVVDTELKDGTMTLSEAVLPGAESDEVLISTYTCHPSMANDNLSGVLASAFLYRRLAALPHRRLTYRFVFLPETIGSIAYLTLRGAHLRKALVAGYVISCIGDRAPFTYKQSRRGNSPADRAAAHVLSQIPGPEKALRVHEFTPDGSDERQYCSPGFNLPVGVIARSIYSHFPEYHSSLDDRSCISFEHMIRSVDALLAVCTVLDRNMVYRNLFPECEPQLGKRGLFPQQGGAPDVENRLSSHLWLLNLADGEHDLLAISERSGIDFQTLDESACALTAAGLIERAKPQSLRSE